MTARAISPPKNGTDSVERWKPIGFNEKQNAYSGTFDGAGHTIYGVYIDKDIKVREGVGLFGYANGAAIKNLSVTGYISVVWYQGGIVGCAKNSTVSDCQSSVTITQSDWYLCDVYSGGIIGYAQENCTITNCVNKGKISAYSGYSFAYAGGIAGGVWLSDINGCYNLGTIESGLVGESGYGLAGGIAGCASSVKITDCYNLGELTSTTDDFNVNLGGIVGMINRSGRIENCYNIGKISAKEKVIKGSIAAEIDTDIVNCFYIGGTADKGVGEDDGNHKIEAEEKIAQEFANGQVLEKMINGRAADEHPWAEKCQYISAAGMTLPVFKGQGDAHTHSGEWQMNNTKHFKVCSCGVVFDEGTHSGNDDGNCTTAINCKICSTEIKSGEKEHSCGEFVQNGDGSNTHTRSCTNDGCKHTDTEKCSGGKATCTQRAVCEICKKSYGETNKNVHPYIKHITAKAATKDADGNIEYWYCDGCDKYYGDAEGTKEIAKAETVTAKLPEEPKSPKTGNGNNTVLWIALFFIGGGISGAAVFVKRKRIISE